MKSHSSNITSRFLNQLGPFLALGLIYFLFCIPEASREAFLSLGNLKIILTQSVVVAMASLGMTLIIISGGIDLSVGSMVSLTGVVGALFLSKGYGPVSSILMIMLVGAMVGVFNGTIISKLRMMPFIVTLGMLGVARGTAKWLANEQTVSMPATWLNQLMVLFPQPEWLLVAPGVWITLAMAILLSIVMNKTIFGRYTYAIGSNEATARLCGINVTGMKVIIYCLAGIFFAMAGLMQLARLRQGDPTVAMGLELDVIAAVVIGGASLSGGTGTVLGSMIGALMMAVLRNGSQQMGWPTYVQEIMIGAVIIIAVFIDKLRQSQLMKS